MAEDCITVQFEDRTWNYCWETGVAEPNWDAKNVISGLRRSQRREARSWRVCQYFIKGMSAVCSHWVEDSSSSYGVKCNAGTGSKTPTGYNNGFCDFLGRRHWCDHYSPSGSDNLEEYICVAPNMFLSGVGSIDNQAVPICDIGGYNSEAGSLISPGRCDCFGMGRGEYGCLRVGELGVIEGDTGSSDVIEKELSKLPVICQFYRPYQMSFGGKKALFDIISSQTSGFDERLPLDYIVYNYMSQFQKCQWWNKDYGSDFSMSAGQVVLEDDECFDESGKVIYCKCEDGLASDYNTRVSVGDGDHYMAHGGFMLENVWAKAGGYICNGARPECPCYTGKWNYLTEERMLPGMPVLANQVFELRFWSRYWRSQAEYDGYFLQKPNTSKDPETASIFTFSEWKSLGTLPSDNIMSGKKLSMCQPAPLNAKEFIPEKYIIVELIDYVPMNVEAGTSSALNKIFCSLIKKPLLPDQRPFTIIYPFYSDEAAFSGEVCMDFLKDGHTKYHHTMSNDSITVIGFTVKNKKVYVVNVSEAAGTWPTEHENTILVSRDIRQELFNRIAGLIEDSLELWPEWVSNTVSDKDQGYFIIPPVKLNYGSNDLLVCVDFNDGTWAFERLTVNNEWCGGVVNQTSYTHKFSGSNDVGYVNELPLKISPPATAKVVTTPLGGAVSAELLSIHSEMTPAGDRNYSYSIEEVIGVIGDVEKWCAVGNSSAVFVLLDDINLNYIFNWILISAQMVPKESIDSEGNPNLIRKHAVTIEMEVMDDIDQNSIIPGVCVLKPISKYNRVTFMNSEWSLNVVYEYKKFNESPTSPSGKSIAGAFSSPGCNYKKPPVEISTFGNSATIDNLETGPVGVMVLFKNEDDRIVSTMATKIYVCIADVRCRNVEIKYKYTGTGFESQLQPSGMDFATDVEGGTPTGGNQTYSYAPACGDHDMGAKWEGPMWFPFNVCRGYDLYNVFTFCNHCQAGIVGPMNKAVVGVMDYSDFYGIGDVVQRLDYRYCGVAKSYARGEINAPGTCRSGCNFFTTQIPDYTFTGYGNIRTRFPFMTCEGALPPFGNDGCELTEKYLSCDYVTHRDTYGAVRSEWMPAVMDYNNFYFGFNAFDISSNKDDDGSISYMFAVDPFNYVDQLSLFTLNEISEKFTLLDDYGVVNPDRRSFNELFKIHFEGNCSYPSPVLPPNRVMFYDFKDKDVAWAWKERWKDIERGIDDGEQSENGINKLDFVLKYDKPKYQFSLYKEEHRLICDEGIHDIKYTGPVIEEGKLIKYPTIALDGGVPKPFEIIYNDYNEEQVKWKNHEEVGGSSGENNIYEKTTSGDWLHGYDLNTIFDENASEEENDDRCIVVGLSFDEEVKKYYNRGVDVIIPRNRLVYLPKQEESHNFEFYDLTGYRLYLNVNVTEELNTSEKAIFNTGGQYTTTFMWDQSVVIETKEEVQSVPFSIVGIKLKGIWGYTTAKTNKYIMIKPGISLAGIRDDGDSSIDGFSTIQTEWPYWKESFSQYKEYEIETKFAVTPKSMIDKPLKGFRLTLEGAYGYYIAVTSIELTITTGYKEEGNENIKVWERKYIPSIFSKGNEQFNLDGPGDHMSYHLDGWNAGVYYPFAKNIEPGSTTGPPLVGGGGGFGGGGASGGWTESDDTGTSQLSPTIKAANKMRGAYANDSSRYDKRLSINMGNLHEIEEEKQKLLYESAYDMEENGDQLTFSSVMPPQISDNIGTMYHGSRRCKFEFGRIKWDYHALVKQFKQWDFWQPGGHSYSWSSSPTKQKCKLFGGEHMIHSGILLHHEHTGQNDPVAACYFNAYYTVRGSAVTAKYARFMVLTGEPPDAGWDLLAQASPYYTGPRQ